MHNAPSCGGCGGSDGKQDAQREAIPERIPALVRSGWGKHSDPAPTNQQSLWGLNETIDYNLSWAIVTQKTATQNLSSSNSPVKLRISPASK